FNFQENLFKTDIVRDRILSKRSPLHIKFCTCCCI
ncbi:unnamed protein product, partial [Larinioides sclopetarius]